MTKREAVRKELQAAAEWEYREFHSKLVPDAGDVILGVRTPILRGLAKKLVKNGWREYIAEVSCGSESYEEKILWGLCICGGCQTWEEAAPYVRDFIPVIHNWAVCDIFCGSLKVTRKYPGQVWEFIQPYLKSDQEYEVRFGVVMLLSHFADSSHAEEALKALDAVRHEGYYARMAVAWAISVYFVKLPDQVMPYLKRSSLDTWTYNKALQKITESYRVDQNVKKEIRALKRKS